MDKGFFAKSGSGSRRSRGSVVPVGGIILLNTVSIPSGFTRFSAADDRFILGAGSTYSVGETGGQSTGFSFYSQNSGGHSGSIFPAAYGGIAGEEASGYAYLDYHSGTHGHEITFDCLPEYQGLILAQADAIATTFPANAIVLTVTADNPGGLSRCYDDDNFVRSQSTIDSDAGGMTGVTVEDGGLHKHAGIQSTYPESGASGWKCTTGGTHSHPDTLSTAWALKCMLLAAWTKTSSFDVTVGNIILFGAGEIPTGWKLCDGTLGTPDFRDYFLKLCSADEGTTEGNNSLTLSGTLDSYNASHDHKGTLETDVFATQGMHPTADWTHDHVVNDAQTILPPYYGLRMLIKA